jgi:hypothetical protein
MMETRRSIKILAIALLFIASCACSALAQRPVVPPVFPGGVRTSTAGVEARDALGVVASELRGVLPLEKTLVVWFVEAAPQARTLRENAASAIVDVSRSLADEFPQQLELAAISYGDEAKWLLKTPTRDAEALGKALEQASSDGATRVSLCAALREAIDQFAKSASGDRQVLFVVIGTSTPDDMNAADAVLVDLKQAAIPVIGIGPAARFGATVAETVRMRRETSPADRAPEFESLYPERIRLALSGRQGTSDLVDAGFGPFGLERICRQSGGRFLRLRDVGVTAWELDVHTGDIRPDVLRRYMPDYVSEQQYRRLLDENGCRKALHEAAQLPAVFGLDEPTLDFPMARDEAAMANRITAAQRLAAVREQPINQLYNLLAPAESDRAGLTGARWQAGYDLAMGQVLAAKARLDGYNAMLAALKQGKKFQNAGSTTWTLEPDEEIPVGSALDRMAKNSRTYLKRVVDEHPNTPWAVVAERELSVPAGWKFVEK